MGAVDALDAAPATTALTLPIGMVPIHCRNCASLGPAYFFRSVFAASGVGGRAAGAWRYEAEPRNECVGRIKSMGVVDALDAAPATTALTLPIGIN